MTHKIVVGLSGGIDSQACLLWCRKRFPPEDIIALNSDAGGNEHPLTTEYLRLYSETVFPVVTVSAIIADLGSRGTKDGKTRDRRQEFADTDPLTFDILAYVNGRFPSRKAQFCTEHLKLAPQERWLDENLIANGIGYDRYIGVRADESQDRAKLPEKQWDEYFDTYLYRPLLKWKKQQCFDFVLEAGEPINPLYTMGFNRVGCAPCINSSKDNVLNWTCRFPEMIDKVRAWENRVGRTFFAPCVPGLTINWIDEVVAWSKTTHGGKQLALPLVEADKDSCVSKYGLCE